MRAQECLEIGALTLHHNVKLSTIAFFFFLMVEEPIINKEYKHIIQQIQTKHETTNLLQQLTN